MYKILVFVSHLPGRIPKVWLTLGKVSLSVPTTCSAPLCCIPMTFECILPSQAELPHLITDLASRQWNSFSLLPNRAVSLFALRPLSSLSTGRVAWSSFSLIPGSLHRLTQSRIISPSNMFPECPPAKSTRTHQYRYMHTVTLIMSSARGRQFPDV